MNDQKEMGVITSQGLTSSQIEAQRLKILTMKENAEQIIADSKEIKEEKEDVCEDDKALNSSLYAMNGPVRKKQLFNAQKTIIDCNNALLRIKNGTYGICFQTGEPIAKEMMRANPFRTRKTI